MLSSLRLPSALIVFGLAMAVGCDNSPRFEADAIALVDRRIVPEHREQIAEVLEKLFGTPDEPRVPESLTNFLDEELIEQAAGPVESHTVGETIGLFRRHCARCHGVTGNGRGPTALYQAPYPRDFRRGVFKFKLTKRGTPPTDDDLHAVLVRGVAGAAMPSFALLKPEERESLVEYIKFLSIRGSMEALLVDYVAEEFEFDPDTGETLADDSLVDDPELIEELLDEVATPWREAADAVIAAEPTTLANAERIEAGRALFHDTQRANCAKCHGKDGSGLATINDFDDWNKRRHDFAEATRLLAAKADSRRTQLFKSSGVGREQLQTELAAINRQVAQREEVVAAMLPARQVTARRLAGTPLHGGGEPIDLFRVIHEGVAGAPMPGVGATLSDDEIWNLVAYVQSLYSPPSQGGVGGGSQ